MTDLPAPLVPDYCDCTDLDGFMLNVEKLMASELVALATHEQVAAAMFLWCRAWKQVPAASLPDDDKVNASYARMPLAKFLKVKAVVMRGFVKCSDGRLYHRHLSADAVVAYGKKLAFQKKRNGDAERLRAWREKQRRGSDDQAGEMPPDTPDETAGETHFVAEGQGQGQGQVVKKEAAVASAREPALSNPDPAIALLDEIAAVVGAQQASSPAWLVATEPRRWLDGGCERETDILPTVRRMHAARAGIVGWPPKSPAYFTQAIADAKAARLKPMPEGSPDHGRQAEQAEPDRSAGRLERALARVNGGARAVLGLLPGGDADPVLPAVPGE